MSLIAIRASDGTEIESFSIDRDIWKVMQKQPLGTYVMNRTHWPAVLKRSIRGLQFFAYAAGYTGIKPEPESLHHQLSKVIIASTLRAAGYSAKVEQQGSTPEGEEWQADVLSEANGRTIAFEVQLSQQTLDEYQSRSDRYLRSGVKTIWLVRAKNYRTLTNALLYRYGGSDGFSLRPAVPHIAALPFEIGELKESAVEDLRVVVFLNTDAASAQRISLAEFAIGVAEGRLSFSAKEWRWKVV
ncbi:hypothetical protein D9O50_09115 [Oxalobacteraceae bacterium CAVE-383]|nr:hypothetical protein D9O50_09115 [Oxalobacteraceae bacterium CAVE-383]